MYACSHLSTELVNIYESNLKITTNEFEVRKGSPFVIKSSGIVNKKNDHALSKILGNLAQKYVQNSKTGWASSSPFYNSHIPYQLKKAFFFLFWN